MKFLRNLYKWPVIFPVSFPMTLLWLALYWLSALVMLITGILLGLLTWNGEKGGKYVEEAVRSFFK